MWATQLNPRTLHEGRLGVTTTETKTMSNGCALLMMPAPSHRRQVSLAISGATAGTPGAKETAQQKTAGPAKGRRQAHGGFPGIQVAFFRTNTPKGRFKRYGTAAKKGGYLIGAWICREAPEKGPPKPMLT